MFPGAELPKKVVLRRIEPEEATLEVKKSAAGVWLATLSTNCELVRARRPMPARARAYKRTQSGLPFQSVHPLVEGARGTACVPLVQPTKLAPSSETSPLLYTFIPPPNCASWGGQALSGEGAREREGGHPQHSNVARACGAERCVGERGGALG